MSLDLSSVIGFPRWSDFRLIFQNTTIYVRSSLLSILSPVISRQLSSNPTNLQFTFPSTPDIPSTGFSDFVSYLYGQQITLTLSNIRFLYFASSFLLIPDLPASIISFLSAHSPPVIFSFLHSLFQANIPVPDLPSRIAEHIDDLLFEGDLLSPNVRLISEIVTSPSFKSERPLALTEYLIHSIDQSPDWVTRALSAIAGKCLDPDILTALGRCPTFDFRTIKTEIGRILSQCENRKSPQREFPFERKLSEGIIAQIRRLVTVTASSVFSQHTNPENVLQFLSDAMYSSEEGPFDWIQIVFGELKVIVTRYALKRAEGGEAVPVAWQLAGSDDGVNWVTIDQVSRDDRLVNSGEGSWGIRGNWKAFSRIRLLQIATSDTKNQRFMLGGIELFGSVIGLEG